MTKIVGCRLFLHNQKKVKRTRIQVNLAVGNKRYFQLAVDLICIKINISILQIFLISNQMNSQTQSTQPLPKKPCRSLLLIKRKKFKNIRQCHDKKGNQKQGMWNLTQTMKYIAFIKANVHRFQSQETRRVSRVFCLMSRQIKSRSSVQCRSHHQKMVQTYGQIHQVIAHYEKNVIPYYRAKINGLDSKSTQNRQPKPFYSFQHIGNVLRIIINEDCIQCY